MFNSNGFVFRPNTNLLCKSLRVDHFLYPDSSCSEASLTDGLVLHCFLPCRSFLHAGAIGKFITSVSYTTCRSLRALASQQNSTSREARSRRVGSSWEYVLLGALNCCYKRVREILSISASYTSAIWVRLVHWCHISFRWENISRLLTKTIRFISSGVSRGLRRTPRSLIGLLAPSRDSCEAAEKASRDSRNSADKGETCHWVVSRQFESSNCYFRVRRDAITRISALETFAKSPELYCSLNRRLSLQGLSSSGSKCWQVTPVCKLREY